MQSRNETENSPYIPQISIAVTISAADQEWRGITWAEADRKCVQKQIKDSSSSGETLDNLLSLETRDQESEGSDPPSEEKKCKFQPICSGRGCLCAWLTLNEAVCLPKWILPTPNHSISLLFSSPAPPYRRRIVAMSSSACLDINGACLLAPASHYFVMKVLFEHSVSLWRRQVIYGSTACTLFSTCLALQRR